MMDDNALLAAIVGSSEDAIISKDLDGIITSWNPAAARLFGYSAVEAIGRPVEMLFPPDRLAEESALMARVAGGEVITHVETVRRRKDGSDVDVAVTLSPLRDSAGQIIGVSKIAHETSHRKSIERALRDKEHFLSESQRVAHIGSWSFDLIDQIIWSDETYRIYGVSPDTFTLTVDSFLALIHPDDRPAIARWITEARAGGAADAKEYRVVSPDGTLSWVRASGAIQYDGQNRAHTMIGVTLDITELMQAEEQLRIAAAAFESQDGIIVTDPKWVIQRVNKAFTAITGYAADEVIGRKTKMLESSEQDAAFHASFLAHLERHGTWQGEAWERRKSGEIFPAWLTVTAVVGTAGELTHYVATMLDITARKAAAKQIEYLAYYDSLTGLPNRRLLIDRLTHALQVRTRNGSKGALLFIDLDNFKVLNDTLGHNYGDLLLQEVARRLGQCVRDGDTVARLGGDEFVVMLEELSDNRDAAAQQTEVVGSKILSLLAETCDLGGHPFRASASIGATLFQDHQDTVDGLLKRADIAMYQAKAAGRDTLRFFDPQVQAAVAARSTLEGDLAAGIRGNQLRLYLQPQVETGTNLIGAEALVRWQHPHRGLVSPGDFIPLAEETGLILPLGAWVLETACRQIVSWSTQAASAHLTLAVNVSARQIQEAHFVQEVLDILRRTGANPNRLKLELTESMLVDDVEAIIPKMMALKRHGIGFSLDDFGTGYSSLSYLKRLPLSQLKIDRSFVRDVLTDPNDAAIARTIIALAHSLGLNVIAEGVETEGQRAFLAEHACNAYQGYLFSRPLPADEFGLGLLHPPRYREIVKTEEPVHPRMSTAN